MRERGGKLKRYLDFFIGIPLLWLAVVFRLLFRRKNTTVKPAYATGGWAQPQNAAILCLAAVGDTVLLSGLIKALAGKQLELDLYVSSANKGLDKLLPPVNAIYSFSLIEIPQMIEQIRQRKYQYFIDSSPWARLPAIVSALSDAIITIGF
ncbi:MAG: hypothetical protein LBV04_09545, partial [Deferribacteraceae bacterium]|nr:hypothetical protein [Deferribacteraceae bacterium]